MELEGIFQRLWAPGGPEAPGIAAVFHGRAAMPFHVKGRCAHCTHGSQPPVLLEAHHCGVDHGDGVPAMHLAQHYAAQQESSPRKVALAEGV